MTSLRTELSNELRRNLSNHKICKIFTALCRPMLPRGVDAEYQLKGIDTLLYLFETLEDYKETNKKASLESIQRLQKRWEHRGCNNYPELKKPALALNTIISSYKKVPVDSNYEDGVKICIEQMKKWKTQLQKGNTDNLSGPDPRNKQTFFSAASAHKQQLKSDVCGEKPISSGQYTRSRD